jgi:hypothetical protein
VSWQTDYFPGSMLAAIALEYQPPVLLQPLIRRV